MATIHNFDVHAGDFGDGMAWYGSLAGAFNLPAKDKTLAREKVAKDQVSALEIATEENVKSAGGALGWGILGGAMLGPVGLLAGLLFGWQVQEGGLRYAIQRRAETASFGR